jgi:hypothetical protein
MTADTDTSPNYKPELVEQVLLEVAVDLYPACLTAPELSLKIAANPDDNREIETITEAIHELRRCRLFRYRRDSEAVKPTEAALRAVELLTR